MTSETPRTLPVTITTLGSPVAAAGPRVISRSAQMSRRRRQIRSEVRSACVNFIRGLPSSSMPDPAILFNRVWRDKFRKKRTETVTAEHYISRAISDTYRDMIAEARTPAPPPPARIMQIPMLRIVASTIPHQDAREASVEEIERMFFENGFGESGRQCPICMESKKLMLQFSNECSHFCCVCCYSSYLDSSLEGKKFPIACPGCKAGGQETLIDPMQVVQFVRTAKVTGRHRENVMRFNKMQILGMRTPESVLAINACPTCGFLGFLQKPSDSVAMCSNPECAEKYCPACKNRPHPGKTCQERQAEIAALEKPGATDTVMKNTSKACPNCSMPISHFRDHGCHHITCGYCKHQFCWLCTTSWLSRPSNHACPMMCNASCGCVPCDSCVIGKSCPACMGCSKCRLPIPC